MRSKNLLLVTGASSGIGREISRKLCKEGHEVILASRSKEKLNSLHNELKKLGYKSHVIPCDIRVEDEVNHLYEESSKLGFVDCVINNAGIGKFSSINKMSIEDWDEQINTNLRSSFLTTRLFVKKMIEKKEGKFVFINSVAGKYGHSFSSSTAYVASKCGLKGFADSLRTELREHNIKVISVYPGAIDTNFWDSINVDFPRDEMLSSSDLAEAIFHAIAAPNLSVIEDIVVRRTKGDF